MIRFSNRVVYGDGFYPIECDTNVYLTCKCRKNIVICQDRSSIKRLAFIFPDDWDVSTVNDISFTVWDSKNGSSPAVFTSNLNLGGFVRTSTSRIVMNYADSTTLSQLSAGNRYFEVWAESKAGRTVLLDKGSYETRLTRKYT